MMCSVLGAPQRPCAERRAAETCENAMQHAKKGNRQSEILPPTLAPSYPLFARGQSLPSYPSYPPLGRVTSRG